MLDKIAATEAISAAPRLTMAQARMGQWAGDPAMQTLVTWIETYLMQGHPDLGRTGAVCPFTKQAAKLDTVRVAISRAGADDENEAFELMRRCFAELEQVPCKPGMEHFRTIIVGFPDCNTSPGKAMLEQVQKRNKFYSLSRFRMIGYMFEGNEAAGLWNPDFRPLRAPMPVLALRHLVEQDAPFAARHPLLMIPYLARFRFAGLKRLREYWRR